MNSILGFCCGIGTALFIAALIILSNFLKFALSWDGRYMALSWWAIYRAEKAYKRGDMAEYYRIMNWEDTRR